MLETSSKAGIWDNRNPVTPIYVGRFNAPAVKRNLGSWLTDGGEISH
jgi:hypothetical protein